MLIQADARNIPLADNSVHCCVTSPPYWGLRDYGTPGQLGLETTPDEYLTVMVDVFREVWRVLREDGTLWLNMGDCYATGAGKVGECGHVYYGPMTQPNRMPIEGLKAKDLVGMPWRLAFALQADGWWLRSDIIWSKRNPMPESVTDRPTKSHEYIFLLTKSERYYYDAEAIKEDSVTSDMRRPYAPGQVDSRGNGHDRGGGTLRKQAVPTGWDTGPGAHGNIHKDGRRRPKPWDNDMGSNRTLVQGYRRRNDRFGGNKHNAETTKHSDGSIFLGSPLRNKRSVWEVNPQPFPEAHFATFPEELIKPCILAGCPEGGIVFDPFVGSGTTILVAENLQCHGIGLELNPDYIEIAKRRLAQSVMVFA